MPLIGLGSSAVLAFVLIGPVRELALRYGFADRPGGHKTHTGVVPYLGGVVVMLASLIPAGFAARGLASPMLTLCLAALAVGLLGLVDDIRPLSPGTKLVWETAAALIVVGSGIRAELTGVGWLDATATAMWLVLMVNSTNLLDNSDAALPCIGVSWSGVMCVAALLSGQPGVAVLAATVAGALLGFLSYNWPPARMYLGDAGSLFLGFLLTGLAVYLSGSMAPGAVTAGWLLLLSFPAVIDTALVVLSRVRAGRPVTMGGTDHVAHRLRRLGFTKPAVACGLGGGAAVAGIAGLAVASGRVAAVPALVVALVVAMALVLALIRVRASDRRKAPRSKAMAPP